MHKLELIMQAQNFQQEFASLGIDLDYSIGSLEKVESYIESTISEPGKIKKKSFFKEDTYPKAFAYGCYAGEVMRRAGHGLKWVIEDPESPIGVSLDTPGGGKSFVINKAFKRVFEGDGDNVHNMVRIMLSQHNDKDAEIPEGYYDDVDLKIQKYQNDSLTFFLHIKRERK